MSVTVNEAANGGWYSVADAASQLGLPERAIYRQIATQALRARRDELGGLMVCLDADARPRGGAERLVQQDHSDTALTPDRARALTEFASGLLDPLLSRLAQQEAVIREQAEELGRLRARAEIAAQACKEPTASLTDQLTELSVRLEEVARLTNRRGWWPFG